MAEGSEPSFGWLVFRRAWFGALGFFESWRRDLLAASVSFAVGESIYYRTHGLPATWADGVDNLIHLLAPVVVLWALLFVWHLWLAPSALAYEAARKAAAAAPVAPIGSEQTRRPRVINWAIWKQRDKFTLSEFASVLAKVDPSKPGNDADRDAMLKLIQEDAMARKFPLIKDRLAGAYCQPDLYPLDFSIKKEDAIKWASQRGFDVSHIS